jgi:hypothetical protein
MGFKQDIEITVLTCCTINKLFITISLLNCCQLLFETSKLVQGVKLVIAIDDITLTREKCQRATSMNGKYRIKLSFTLDSFHTELLEVFNNCLCSLASRGLWGGEWPGD